MSKRLKGKVALITGGGSGIGAAIAKRFVESGARVVLTGRREAPLHIAASELNGLALPGDTSKAADCDAAIASTLDHFGRLDIVVANAGLMSMGNVTELDLDEWSSTLAVNVAGVLNICRSALPTMIKGGGGSILTVSSVAGLAGMRDSSAYVTSKHALQGLTKSLAIDYGQHGIRVNALAPGWVDTPMSRAEMQALAERENITSEQALHRTTAYLPLARMAKACEIAACAEFLVSDDASFVTGATLVADGGGDIVDVGSVAL